jgi:hypothetical protein
MPVKQIASCVTRAAVLRYPNITAGMGQFAVIQSVAPSVGVEVSPVNLSKPQHPRFYTVWTQGSHRVGHHKIHG